MTTTTPWAVQPITPANAWVIYRIEDVHNARGKVVASRRCHAFGGKLFATQVSADQLAKALNQPVS